MEQIVDLFVSITYRHSLGNVYQPIVVDEVVNRILVREVVDVLAALEALDNGTHNFRA
jgi:hypothetical protein